MTDTSTSGGGGGCSQNARNGGYCGRGEVNMELVNDEPTSIPKAHLKQSEIEQYSPWQAPAGLTLAPADRTAPC